MYMYTLWYAGIAGIAGISVDLPECGQVLYARQLRHM